MRKIFIFSLLAFTISFYGFSQHYVMQKEIDKHGIISFMVFDNKTSFISVGQAKKLLKDTLKMRQEDDLLLMKETKDTLGFTRQYYQQYYKGIQVEYGRYGVHSKNEKIEYIEGEYKNVKNVSITPSLTEKEALQKALNFIHADIYKWEIPNEEQFIKELKNDSMATNYPKGELLICRDVLKMDSVYRLSYKFDIYAVKPISHKIYYIDAITGEVLDINNLICDANSMGSAATRYSGVKTITTDSYSSPLRYRLRETRNGVRLETYNMQRSATFSNTDFTDIDNLWSSTEYDNLNKDNSALDAHWGLEKVYDYWYIIRERNSLDNQGYPLLNYVHANLTGLGYGSNNDNAFWDGQRMIYGDGTNYNPFVSLDMVAHETGHGIAQFTINLGSGGESGALNEGLSDIWAAVIEHWAVPNDPTKHTWEFGEQIVKDGTCFRSFNNPKSKGYPNTYHGYYWDSNGEVHKNSTVLSYWFYLLSQGGNGTNDLSHPYNVYGLGIDEASKIVYQTETVNLLNHPSADYNTMMSQTIQATIDLYTASSLR